MTVRNFSLVFEFVFNKMLQALWKLAFLIISRGQTTESAWLSINNKGYSKFTRMELMSLIPEKVNKQSIVLVMVNSRLSKQKMCIPRHNFFHKTAFLE